MTSENANVPDLTPKHVRAARALLAWSQQDLAKKAEVAVSTVADFERGSRKPVPNNALAVRYALEGAGIRFLPTGAIVGPPIPRIRASDKPGAPIRWVSAEDLGKWADRIDGAVSLPRLISSLISATHGIAIEQRFPSDEGVRHPGWDGRTFTLQGSIYVPLGEGLWEIGSQRNNIKQKATDDYKKRIKNPGTNDPADATYIFVTPRHWPQKEEWKKACLADGIWRDVRAYDADDLIHWIEQTPAVGLWLATRVGKRPSGTQELEEVWQEWSHATEWPLSEELVLVDRDENATDILKWLRGEPALFSIQAATTAEAVAFLHATLTTLPEDAAAHYRARCLVASGADAARALINSPLPQIIALTDPDPGLAGMLIEHGHYVLQTYDDRQFTGGAIRKLARPSRKGIASALISMGIAETRARVLARDSARSLAVLRRLIPSAPGGIPKWACSPPRALLAAMLAGGWDEASDGDKAKLCELALKPYDQLLSELVPFVGDFDSPLRKVGSAWRVTSPPDAWILLAPYLTSEDVERFKAVAQAVLGAPDPRFNIESGKRWLASIRGIRPTYSEVLRYGVGEVLICLALWSDKIRASTNARDAADQIVRALLRTTDPQLWWSLSRDFCLLAEASPTCFLSAIEDSLDDENLPIKVLFGSDEGGFFHTEHLSDLLWALEALAWSPDFLPRVSLILGRLDAIDSPQGRFLNRPANSLRQIHLLWHPQTFATLDQRLRAFDSLRKHENNAAWKLMLGVLPRGHDSSTPSATPKWRDFSVDKAETVTWALIGRGASAISERLLQDVGVNVVRWQLLLDRLADLAPGPQAGLEALEAAEPAITNRSDRADLWAHLRGILHHHRRVPDAEWALSTDDAQRVEQIYNLFAPDDSIERQSWLFITPIRMPHPSHQGWQAEGRDIEKAQSQAAFVIFKDFGVEGILKLARLATSAEYIGRALVEAELSDVNLDEILMNALQSKVLNERNVAFGLIVSLFPKKGMIWAGALIQAALAQEWGDAAVLTVLHALPRNQTVWDLAAKSGSVIEREYWVGLPIFWTDDAKDASFAVNKLMSVGRARHAIHMAAHDRKIELPSTLLVDLLREAARQPFGPDGDKNEPIMFQHHLISIFDKLDKREDILNETFIELEWIYLPILEYSSRPAKALLKALSEDPSLFIQLISAIFKPSEDIELIETALSDPDRSEAIADQAYRLLQLWNRIPGTDCDGTIDGEALEKWIKEARAQAKAVARLKIADDRIGKMLSAAPIGSDGVWPAEPVRHVLDLFRSPTMLEAFRIGKSNRRGVTTRLPHEGGEQERVEATKYRKWAAAIIYEFPYTAKALDTLADSYEHQARFSDEDAERLDWQM